MLPETYDPLLVALSYVVAVAGSYTIASLAPNLTDANGRLRVAWLLGATGVHSTGIWGMHFLGMLALRLPVRVAYDVPLTLLSFAVAAAGVCAAAIVIAPQLTPREPFVPAKLIAAGILFGLGVAGLHYTGMAAMRMAARTHHSAPSLLASIVIVSVLGGFALWIARAYLLTDPGRWLWRKWATSLTAGLAIVGQHYTAMAGTQFSPGPDTQPLSEWGLLPAQNLPLTVLLVTLAVVVTALVSGWTDRRRATRAAIAIRMLAGRENERRGIARVLHEDVGQLLTALKLNLERLDAPDRGAPIVRDSIDLVDDALKRVRALSLDLRPSVLDDLGLAAAVKWFSTRQAERAGYLVEVVENVGDRRLDEVVETAAFRIVQQALTNVARHAGARNVSISMQLAPRALDVSIADDGVGFNVGAARIRAEAGESLGLLDMKEMATLSGAIYSVTSLEGRGSTVHVRFTLTDD